MNLVNDPVFSREAVGQYEDKPLKPHRPKKIQSYAIKETSGNGNKGTAKCPICEGQHDIEECTTILEQTVEDRSKTIYKKRLCYGCLEEISKEHNAKLCSNRRQCKVCNGRHPTILHGIKIEKKKLKKGTDKVAATPKSQDEVKCASINTGSNVISMCKVPVKIKGSSSSNVIYTYALLDSWSQGTFILDQLRDHLRIPGRETSVTIKTINGEIKSPSKAIDGLQVSGINDDKSQWVPLPKTFTRAELPVDNDDVTKPGQLKQWKYLESVINQLNLEENISVGLLIGANCTKALEPIQTLQSRNGGPYASRTRLGWCVVGPVSGTRNISVSCNKIVVRQADTNQVSGHFFQSKREVKENDITDMLHKMYNHGFTESQHKVNRENDGKSQEDLKFMQVLNNGAKPIDGHYEIPLPLRDDNVRFPNNRSQAEKRFIYLQRKMSRNHQFRND